MENVFSNHRGASLGATRPLALHATIFLVLADCCATFPSESGTFGNKRGYLQSPPEIPLPTSRGGRKFSGGTFCLLTSVYRLAESGRSKSELVNRQVRKRFLRESLAMCGERRNQYESIDFPHSSQANGECPILRFFRRTVGRNLISTVHRDNGLPHFLEFSTVGSKMGEDCLTTRNTCAHSVVPALVSQEQSIPFRLWSRDHKTQSPSRGEQFERGPESLKQTSTLRRTHSTLLCRKGVDVNCRVFNLRTRKVVNFHWI